MEVLLDFAGTIHLLSKMLCRASIEIPLKQLFTFLQYIDMVFEHLNVWLLYQITWLISH